MTVYSSNDTKGAKPGDYVEERAKDGRLSKLFQLRGNGNKLQPWLIWQWGKGKVQS